MGLHGKITFGHIDFGYTTVSLGNIIPHSWVYQFGMDASSTSRCRDQDQMVCFLIFVTDIRVLGFLYGGIEGEILRWSCSLMIY